MMGINIVNGIVLSIILTTLFMGLGILIGGLL